MAASAILKIPKIYLGRGSSDFDKLWRLYAVRPSWPFRTLKISNFENPRSRGILKIEKSPYIGGSSSDFDEIWHTDALRPSWPFRLLKIWNFKNQHVDVRHLEKSKNRHILAVVGAISTKFGIVMQFHPLNRSDRWKIEILIIQAVNWYA